MPWVEKLTTRCGLKGRETVGPTFEGRGCEGQSFELSLRWRTRERRRHQLLYNLLFRCASETLLELAADPKQLGARIGVLAVLHTWSQ
jgi:hypothetical protein